MTSIPARQRTEALLMLLVANLCWGLSFPLIKAIALTHGRLLPESSSWFITAWTLGPRFILAGLVLLLWQRRSGFADVRALEWQQGLRLGLFAGAGMLFQTDGLQFTAASTSAFLTQFYAIMIPVYLALKSRRLPPWTVWLSSAMVLAGVAILGRFDFRAMRLGRGEAETLLSSVFFMGQILTLENKRFAGNRVMPISMIMFLIQGAAFMTLAFFTAPHFSDLATTWRSPQWGTFTITLTVLSTLCAYMLMNQYQPRITATEAGLIYCMEPVFGSVMALFLPAFFSAWALITYPNEVATTDLLVGGGLITAANLLIQLRPPPKNE